MTDLEQVLKPLRDKIDSIDEQIQTLINQRAQCAIEVAQAKLAAQTDNAPVVFYKPEREARILKRVMERNQGPLSDEVMARIIREIMSSCLALEHPLRVAYFGPAGTYTHSAAIKHFGHAAEQIPLATINQVFREVEAGACQYGVVPVENSIEGMVNHTLDTFMKSSLKICGEVELRIHHQLMTSEANKPENITRIYSHEQSLAQCRQWLDTHYPNVEKVAVSSNSEAAKRIKDEWHAAAIAGEIAAEMYGLKCIEKNIEDDPDNTTRFLVIGRESVAPSGSDKTSIIVSAKNRPGALYHLLEPFQQNGVSLTRIETRPTKQGTWAYVFFMDFDGHETDPAVMKTLEEVEKVSVQVTRLGSYPKGIL